MDPIESGRAAQGRCLECKAGQTGPRPEVSRIRTFLLWQRAPGSAGFDSADRVAAKLDAILAPLLEERSRTLTWESGAASLVCLEMPTERWRPESLQEDARTRALAVQFPLDAHRVLEARGFAVDPIQSLPALCRELDREPEPLLRRLSPPFALVWLCKESGDVRVQNDGLGHAQLFEYEGPGLWALTNRIAALRALGVALEPEPEDWAVWATLGWFPMQRTGWRGVRFVGPGTGLRLTPGGREHLRRDVLPSWTDPPACSEQARLDLAYEGLHRYLEAAATLWSRASAGLSGGRDSRAVVACLRSAKLRFRARVRGLSDREDVTIARELALRAELRLKVRHETGLPPEDLAECRRSIEHALLWQAGGMVTRKHKTFLARRSHLSAGGVSITGQYGEIGRAFYAKKLGGEGDRPGEWRDRLLQSLVARRPPFLRAELARVVPGAVEEAIDQAEQRGFEGRRALDFFYLFERTRRWGSASQAAQTGQVVAPFLTPDFIRASFARGGQGNESSPLHEYVIQRDAPEWVDVPYTDPPDDPVSDPTRGWKQPLGRYNYDSGRYWAEVGWPLLFEGARSEGSWTRIVDPDRVQEQWQAAPDVLAVLLQLEAVIG